MTRWTNNDAMGQFESLLVGLSSDDRDQATTLWTADRVRRAARASRRRDERLARRQANLIWLTATALIVLGFWLLRGEGSNPELRSYALRGIDPERPSDFYGPDERSHVAAGREMFR